MNTIRLMLVLPLVLVAIAARAGSFEAAVVDGDGAALADAVTWLVPTRAMPAATGKATSASMDQRGLQFVPHVLVVQRGTAVSFPNSDQVRHHVYSFSPARKFELRLYKSIPAEPVVFDKTGIATLGCNIHDWMLGYVVVVDTPLFAKTDETGHLTISDVPAGEYRLELWHPRDLDAGTDRSEMIRIDGPAPTRTFMIRTRPPSPTTAPTELEQKFRAYRKTPPGDA